MTKKHFQQFAGAIREMKGQPGITEHARQVFADTVASIAKQDNQNFDKARFYAACDLDPQNN